MSEHSFRVHWIWGRCERLLLKKHKNKLGARTLGARSGGSKSGKFMILIAILQYLEAKIVYAPFIIFNHWGHTIIHKNVKLFWPELKMWYQVFSIFRMYCEPKAPSWIQRAPQHFTEAKRKGRQASWSSSNHYITVQCYTALYWHWHTPWGHSYSTGCSLNQMGGNRVNLWSGLGPSTVHYCTVMYCTVL